MRLQLVVREHDLGVEGADDAIDRVLQQDDPLPLVGRVLEHVVEKQCLAQRRRNFGDENRVARIHKGLMRVRKTVCIECPISCASVNAASSVSL